MQKIRGNDYVELGYATVAIILNDKQGNEKTRTLIDKEDLEKVLNKGTWIAEWHNEFYNYLVQNVSYYYVGEKKYRKKITLHELKILKKQREQ